jgi:rRNA maturation protein Nop10
VTFAEEVYSSLRAPRGAEKFAELVYGKEDVIFRSPEQIRRHWRSEMRRRVGYGPDGDRDNVILVTAKMGKGEGKSAMIQDAALEADPSFGPELEHRVTFKASTFLDVVNSLSRAEHAVYDEAGNSLLSTEFWSEETRLLMKSIMMSRDTHATLWLALPTVSLFNKAFMSSLIDYWYRLENRGTLYVHPKPPERYTELRGRGWFPDREWNPYTWPAPHEWSPERVEIWKRYRVMRKKARGIALEENRMQIEQLQSKRLNGGYAATLITCPKCGKRGNKYNIDTHHCKGSPGGLTGKTTSA